MHFTQEGPTMKLRSTLRIAGLVAVVLATAACSANPSRQQVGTATGAVVGGAVGHVIGGGTLGTVTGAAAGALIGSELGKKK
jgi:osmotically inducible lipoprotein OsmB